MRSLATDPACMPTATDDGRWRARLSLGFADDCGTTRLVERSHVGPLRVQKPLYPEGAAVCHAVIVHPPGGVAGGDELSIAAQVGAGASALLTTPGAGKWYKANGRVARQQVDITVADGATLEWLPQETIVFDAADVQLENTIVLGQDARYLGCEILCFGRTASGERFRTGQLAQRTSIRSDGKLLWFEQGRLAGGSAPMHNALGLAGKTVCATFIAVGKSVPPALITSMREACAQGTANGELFGLTQMKSLVVARYLGDSSETAKRLMGDVWRSLRPALCGRDAIIPRMWNT